jgi:hypothetical protein
MRYGSTLLRCGLGVLVVAAAVGLGALVMETSPKSPQVLTTHFAVAHYVPPIPTGIAMGVPIRSLDPGFTGGITQVIGKVELCSLKQVKRTWVALARAGHVATGQFVGANGGFALSLRLPPPNGALGPPVVYTLLASTGVSAQVQLAWGSTTFFVLTTSCS